MIWQRDSIEGELYACGGDAVGGIEAVSAF